MLQIAWRRNAQAGRYCPAIPPSENAKVQIRFELHDLKSTVLQHPTKRARRKYRQMRRREQIGTDPADLRGPKVWSFKESVTPGVQRASNVQKKRGRVRDMFN